MNTAMLILISGVIIVTVWGAGMTWWTSRQAAKYRAELKAHETKVKAHLEKRSGVQKQIDDLRKMALPSAPDLNVPIEMEESENHTAAYMKSHGGSLPPRFGIPTGTKTFRGLAFAGPSERLDIAEYQNRKSAYRLGHHMIFEPLQFVLMDEDDSDLFKRRNALREQMGKTKMVIAPKPRASKASPK